MNARAVIFDLDGVLVTTDELHYHAWKAIADAEGIPFDRQVNHRLRGVSRMESLAIILENAPRTYSPRQREQLAEHKNQIYRASLSNLDAQAILPGAIDLLDQLHALKIPCAVASSSRNARLILQRTGLAPRFAAVVDGTDITESKPHPQVFLKAAHQLGVDPTQCVAVEDAESGVEAALAAQMRVLGVGDHTRVGRAHRVVDSLAQITADELLQV